MIANSTNISARIFRTQRFVVMAIVALFVLLLIITGSSAHETLKNPELYTKASDKLAQYYDSTVRPLWGNSDVEQEKAAEEEEAERLEEEAEAAEAVHEKPAPKKTAEDVAAEEAKEEAQEEAAELAELAEKAENEGVAEVAEKAEEVAENAESKEPGAVDEFTAEGVDTIAENVGPNEDDVAPAS